MQPVAPFRMRHVTRALLAGVTLTATLAALPRPARAVTSPILVSQVYGSGGLAGAPWRNDYIVLFNASYAPVNLGTMSLQAYNPLTNIWQVVPLAGTVAHGRYFLIQLGSSGTNGAALPGPDFTSNVNLLAANASVAVVNGTAPLASCASSPSILDLVGYGTTPNASCHEGAGVAPPTDLTHAIRRTGACTDQNNNASDFTPIPPQPVNSGALDPCADRPPVAPTVPPQSVHAGGTLDVAVGFSDPDSDPLARSASPALPHLTIDPVTHDLVFSPDATQIGHYNVVVTATDPFGLQAACSVDITVQPPADQPPVVAPIGPQVVIEGMPIVVTPSATDPDGDSLSWTGTGLPPFSTVDPATGTFAWLPHYDAAQQQNGLYPVMLIANDGRGGQGSVSFNVTVDDADRAPVIEPLADLEVTAGGTTTFHPDVHDPDGDAVQQSVTASEAAGTFTLNPVTGDWTLHADPAKAGAWFTATLHADDQHGHVTLRGFHVTIVAPQDPPAPECVDLNGDGTLTAADRALLLGFFAGGGTAAAGDVDANADGQTDLADLVRLGVVLDGESLPEPRPVAVCAPYLMRDYGEMWRSVGMVLRDSSQSLAARYCNAASVITGLRVQLGGWAAQGIAIDPSSLADLDAIADAFHQAGLAWDGNQYGAAAAELDVLADRMTVAVEFGGVPAPDVHDAFDAAVANVRLVAECVGALASPLDYNDVYSGIVDVANEDPATQDAASIPLLGFADDTLRAGLGLDDEAVREAMVETSTSSDSGLDAFVGDLAGNPLGTHLSLFNTAADVATGNLANCAFAAGGGLIGSAFDAVFDCPDDCQPPASNTVLSRVDISACRPSDCDAQQAVVDMLSLLSDLAGASAISKNAPLAGVTVASVQALVKKLASGPEGVKICIKTKRRVCEVHRCFPWFYVSRNRWGDWVESGWTLVPNTGNNNINDCWQNPTSPQTAAGMKKAIDAAFDKARNAP